MNILKPTIINYAFWIRIILILIFSNCKSDANKNITKEQKFQDPLSEYVRKASISGDINQDGLIDSVLLILPKKSDTLTIVALKINEGKNVFNVIINKHIYLAGQYGSTGKIEVFSIGDKGEITFSMYWGFSNFRMEYLTTFLYNKKLKDWYLEELKYKEQELDFETSKDEILIKSEKEEISTSKDFGQITFSQFDFEKNQLANEE